MKKLFLLLAFIFSCSLGTMNDSLIYKAIKASNSHLLKKELNKVSLSLEQKNNYLDLAKELIKFRRIIFNNEKLLEDDPEAPIPPSMIKGLSGLILFACIECMYLDNKINYWYSFALNTCSISLIFRNFKEYTNYRISLRYYLKNLYDESLLIKHLLHNFPALSQ